MIVGSNQAEAVRFFVEKKIPAIYVKIGIAGEIDLPFLVQSRPSPTEVPHVV
jgi:hypothetical protein